MSDKKKKPQTPEGEGQGGAAGAGGEPPADRSASSEPPEWFTRWQAEHAKHLDTRFEGMSRKQREMLKKLIDPDHDPDEEKTKAPKGLSDGDVEDRVTAAMRLGEVKAALPEGARKRVDQYAKGRSIRDAVEFAEGLLEMQPEPPKGDPKQAARAVARGVGASPPQDQQVPVTREELRALAKQAATDPEARRRMVEIAKDPTFSRKMLV